MHTNSKNAQLTAMLLGEIRYAPTTLAKYPSDMRGLNTPRSRRPAILAGREFTTKLFTAIAAGDAGDIRYLIAVERTK